MLISLDQAPVETPLVISHIANSSFAARLSRLGLYEGAGISRLGTSVAAGPVKVRGPQGDAVITGAMAVHIVMHLDDDRRLPLLECAPKDSGHVEGLTGHADVEEFLSALCIREHDRVTFLRRVPPMVYNVMVNDKYQLQLSEDQTAKLFGETPEGRLQFSFAGVSVPFTVQTILTGDAAREHFATMHITPGAHLSLMSVGASQVVNLPSDTSIACVTKDGLRFYVSKSDAEDILVTPAAKGNKR